MAAMTVSVPEAMKDWVEAQVRSGRYASADEYLRDLISRDRAKEPEWALERLRAKLAASRAGGIGTRTVDEIYAQSEQIAKVCALMGGVGRSIRRLKLYGLAHDGKPASRFKGLQSLDRSGRTGAECLP